MTLGSNRFDYNLLTPFEAGAFALCRQKPGRVALPESEDPRILAATEVLLAGGLCREVTLFSPPEETLSRAARSGVDLTAVASRIKWAGDDATLVQRTMNLIVETQTKRGRTPEPDAARSSAESRFTQAGDLLHEGHVDAVVAGAVATTAEVIRAAISTVGLAPGIRTVSGAFVMTPPSGSTSGAIEDAKGRKLPPLVFADCGVVPEPTVAQLVDIATSALDTFALTGRVRAASAGDHSKAPDQAFETNPAVAFLSFSTKGSATHPAAARMAEAARLFAARHPGIAVDGELQFDAAIDPEIGARKAPGSAAAGRANIFIFPDLNSGNLAYKITQRLGGFAAIGPLLQGIARPWHDLSRGASVRDIVLSACLALLRTRPS